MWVSLLGRRQLLTGESELGLWGELWCIARSSRAPMMLEAWRGPDAERVRTRRKSAHATLAAESGGLRWSACGSRT